MRSLGVTEKLIFWMCMFICDHCISHSTIQARQMIDAHCSAFRKKGIQTEYLSVLSMDGVVV